MDFIHLGIAWLFHRLMYLPLFSPNDHRGPQGQEKHNLYWSRTSREEPRCTCEGLTLALSI
jgi:hypothetical protein